MNDNLYVVMRHGMPIAALPIKADAIGYSQRIGGPGEGHAIGFVAVPYFTNLELVIEDSN